MRQSYSEINNAIESKLNKIDVIGMPQIDFKIGVKKETAHKITPISKIFNFFRY